jgi:hypothetical protein
MLSHNSDWLRAGRTRVRSSGPDRGKIFSSQSRPDWLWSHPDSCPMSSGCFSTWVRGWGFKLTTRPQLMPRTKIRGSISNTSSWRSVQSVKYNENSIFFVLSRIDEDKTCLNILSRFMWLDIDEVWMGEWIYWLLIHTTRNYKQSATADLHTLEITTLSAFSSVHCFHWSLFGNSSQHSGFFSFCGNAVTRWLTLHNSTIAPFLLSLPCRTQVTGSPPLSSL